MKTKPNKGEKMKPNKTSVTSSGNPPTGTYFPNKPNKGEKMHRYKFSLHCAECFKKFCRREWKATGKYD